MLSTVERSGRTGSTGGRDRARSHYDPARVPPTRAREGAQSRVSDLLVLCLHAVHPRWPAALSVVPGVLEHNLARLVERGYRGATFTDALSGRTRHRRTLVVTFDDGYRSVVEEAKPILDRFELPGTLFVPSSWPDRDEPMVWPGIDQWVGTEFEPQLRCLGWDELRGLSADGWEIGSHTVTHPVLPEVDDVRLAEELRRSRATLEEQLGRACRSLAYPYGQVDDRVEEATAAAGYTTACTIPRVRGLVRDAGPLLWPRTPIHRVDGARRFRVKTSRLLRDLRASPMLTRVARRPYPRS